jgi:hypothetical protein
MEVAPGRRARSRCADPTRRRPVLRQGMGPGTGATTTPRFRRLADAVPAEARDWCDVKELLSHGKAWCEIVRPA